MRVFKKEYKKSDARKRSSILMCTVPGCISLIALAVLLTLFVGIKGQAAPVSSAAGEAQKRETPSRKKSTPAITKGVLDDEELLEYLESQKNPEPRVVEKSMEVVNDVILTSVPVADYSYTFNRNLGNAIVVTRDEEAMQQYGGAYPIANTEVKPKFAEGIEGSCIYLDGTYGIQMEDIEKLGESYTVAFWFKAEEIFDWVPFVAIGTNMLDASVSQRYFSINKKTTEDGESVLPIFNTINNELENAYEVRPSADNKECIHLDEWNYIVITANSKKALEEDPDKIKGYLYLNSELIGTDIISKLYLEPGNINAYLGINCFDRLFKAYYDEVHIWNCCLTENQISTMYLAYKDEIEGKKHK